MSTLHTEEHTEERTEEQPKMDSVPVMNSPSSGDPLLDQTKLTVAKPKLPSPKGTTLTAATPKQKVDKDLQEVERMSTDSKKRYKQVLQRLDEADRGIDGAIKNLVRLREELRNNALDCSGKVTKKKRKRLKRQKIDLLRQIDNAEQEISSLKIVKEGARVDAEQARAVATFQQHLASQFSAHKEHIDFRFDAQHGQGLKVLAGQIEVRTAQKTAQKMMESTYKEHNEILKSIMESMRKNNLQQKNLSATFAKEGNAAMLHRENIANDAEVDRNDAKESVEETMIDVAQIMVETEPNKRIISVEETMIDVAQIMVETKPNKRITRSQSHRRGAEGETKTSSLPGTTGGGGAGAVGVKPKKKKNIIQYNRENVQENSRSRRTCTRSRNTRKKNGE